MSTESPTIERKRLDSWKAIADYVGRDVRTAMRWEEDGLPVRSVPGGQRRGVFAFTDEIDEWLAARDKEPEKAQAGVVGDGEGAVVVHRWRQAKNYVVAAAALLAVIAIAGAVWLIRKHGQREIVFQLQDQVIRFEPVGTVELHGEVGGMIAGDLNGDGWVDLVVGGAPTDRFAVLMNRQGKFDLPVYIANCEASIGPAIGDFDGDGHADIALSCNRERQVQVWWGDGKGGFHSPLMMESGNDPIRCVARDLNHDGITDFIADASGGGPITVYLGHRNRTFTRATYDAGSNPHTPYIADLNDDGNQDIVSTCFTTGCRNLAVLFGKGDGTFATAEELPSVGAGWSVIATDFTGDGIPDILVEALGGEASFFQGIGGGKFLPVKIVPRPFSASLANLYSDGERNYVVEMQLYRYQLRLLSFDGQGNASISNSVPVATNARYAIQSDFNRDGRMDLAILFMSKNDSYVTIYVRK